MYRVHTCVYKGKRTTSTYRVRGGMYNIYGLRCRWKGVIQTYVHFTIHYAVRMSVVCRCTFSRKVCVLMNVTCFHMTEL